VEQIKHGLKNADNLLTFENIWAEALYHHNTLPIHLFLTAPTVPLSMDVHACAHRCRLSFNIAHTIRKVPVFHVLVARA
jgi:hypothetical protein